MTLPFALTDNDVIYLAFGTAAQGIFQWYMRGNFPSAYPTLIQTAIIAAAGLGGGYVGMTTGSVPRALSVFAVGFGLSQAISYALPRITGGAPITSPGGVVSG